MWLVLIQFFCEVPEVVGRGKTLPLLLTNIRDINWALARSLLAEVGGWGSPGGRGFEILAPSDRALPWAEFATRRTVCWILIIFKIINLN